MRILELTTSKLTLQTKVTKSHYLLLIHPLIACFCLSFFIGQPSSKILDYWYIVMIFIVYGTIPTFAFLYIPIVKTWCFEINKNQVTLHHQIISGKKNIILSLKISDILDVNYSNKYKNLVIFLYSGDIINMTPVGYVSEKQEKQLKKIGALICDSLKLNGNQLIAR
jgi:hypothetical protein